MKNVFYGLFIILIACDSLQDSNLSKDQLLPNATFSKPSDTPQVFIASPHINRDFAITSDHKRVLYTMQSLKFKKSVIVEVHIENEKWSSPSIVSFSGMYRDLEPFFHPDDSKLYFASDRPIEEDQDPADFNIWYVEFANEQYSDPFVLDTTINKSGNEFYPSVATNGNIYFTAQRADGVGGEDIYFAKWENGAYLDSEPLKSVSSAGHEFNAFVAPDESFLICSGYNKPDGLGGGDLYIYQKNNNVDWDHGTHMGPPISSPYLDFSPFVDIQNRALYFSSERPSSFFADYAQVDYKEWLDALNSPQNGSSNIYKVKFNLKRD